MKILVFPNFDFIDSIRSQICIFAVMPCAKLWPDWIINFHTKATYMYIHKIWFHEFFNHLFCEMVLLFSLQSKEKEFCQTLKKMNTGVHTSTAFGTFIIKYWTIRHPNLHTKPAILHQWRAYNSPKKHLMVTSILRKIHLFLETWLFAVTLHEKKFSMLKPNEACGAIS